MSKRYLLDESKHSARSWPVTAVEGEHSGILSEKTFAMHLTPDPRLKCAHCQINEGVCVCRHGSGECVGSAASTWSCATSSFSPAHVRLNIRGARCCPDLSYAFRRGPRGCTRHALAAARPSLRASSVCSGDSDLPRQTEVCLLALTLTWNFEMAFCVCEQASTRRFWRRTRRRRCWLRRAS